MALLMMDVCFVLQGSNGWTTLHTAVFYDAPHTFLTKLLELWPDAAQKVASDSAGMPLHIALSRMCPPDFVLELLKANPAAARVPVPCSLDRPSFPLHIAARWGCSEQVVKLLLKEHLKAALVPVRCAGLLPC